MLNKLVQKYIEENKFFTKEDKLIIAFSGGTDSVVLLHLLNSLGYNCVVAHVNFHLRGRESDADEEFARNFCNSLNVPFFRKDLYANDYSKEKGISVEMAARELRYAWFEKLKKEVDADYVCVGHHVDDSIETVFINILRGTGMHGLTGIRIKNDYIVRPLMCCGREDVLKYLKDNNLKYRTDSTNLESIFQRNRIRLEVLPLLERIHPSARKSMINTLENLNEIANIYDDAINKSQSRVCENVKGDLYISKSELLCEVSPKTVLYEILFPYGFGKKDVFKIFKSIYGISGKVFVTKTHRLIIDRDYLILTKKLSKTDNSYVINMDTVILQKPLNLKFSMLKLDDSFVLERSNLIANVDADKLSFPLVLKHYKNGDYFYPLGMKGKKLLSDYCNDKKMNLIEKENLWVLYSNDKIVWVVGERLDDNYKISKDTRKVLKIVLSEN